MIKTKWNLCNLIWRFAF